MPTVLEKEQIAAWLLERKTNEKAAFSVTILTIEETKLPVIWTALVDPDGITITNHEGSNTIKEIGVEPRNVTVSSGYAKIRNDTRFNWVEGAARPSKKSQEVEGVHNIALIIIS